MFLSAINNENKFNKNKFNLQTLHSCGISLTAAGTANQKFEYLIVGLGNVLPLAIYRLPVKFAQVNWNFLPFFPKHPDIYVNA